jgi:hypothetical protein
MHKGIENKKAKVKITGSKKNIQKGWASSIVKFN